MIIRISPKFEKQYKRLPKKIKEQAKEKEEVFRVHPFNPSLKTHKLLGKDSGCWAFWINYSYRIKFILVSQSEVLFLEVGLHNIYN